MVKPLLIKYKDNDIVNINKINSILKRYSSHDDKHFIIFKYGEKQDVFWEFSQRAERDNVYEFISINYVKDITNILLEEITPIENIDEI